MATKSLRSHGWHMRSHIAPKDLWKRSVFSIFFHNDFAQLSQMWQMPVTPQLCLNTPRGSWAREGCDLSRNALMPFSIFQKKVLRGIVRVHSCWLPFSVPICVHLLFWKEKVFRKPAAFGRLLCLSSPQLSAAVSAKSINTVAYDLMGSL